MAETTENRPVDAANFRFFKNTVSVLVLVFCFLAFPLFIIFSALNNLYQVKIGNLRQQKLDQMHGRLEYLEKYSNNSRYLHFLLLRLVEKAEKAAVPTDYLKAALANLHQRYPGGFEFIVWDEKGRVIREITGQKGYSYILARLYEVLRDVSVAVSNDSQVDIGSIRSVSKNLNLVRQFLGRIFIPEYLKKPYLQGNDAGPLLTDFGGRFSSVWYRMGGRISFFCFISEKLLKNSLGLSKIADSLNRRQDGIISGFSISPDFSLPASQVDERFMPTLSLALSQFENVSEPVFENDRAIICMSMPEPGLRTFCLHAKEPLLWSVELNRDMVFVRISVLLCAFYLFLYVYFRFKQQFFSISWKLTGLFLFANLAPLSILGFIAHDYLINRKQALRDEIAGDLGKLMRDFDMRYASLKYDFAREITRKIENVAAAGMNGSLSQAEIDSVKAAMREFATTDAYLIASNGLVFSDHAAGEKDRSDFNFVEPMGEAILKFCNGTILKRNKEDMFSAIMSPEDSDFVRKIYRDQRQVIPLNMANIKKLSYWYIFGDRLKYRNNYFLILFWDEDRFQELYINRYYGDLQKNSFGAPFFARKIDGKKAWAPNGTFPVELARQMERTTGFRENLIGSVMIGDQSHLFVGLKGRSLNFNLLAALYADSRIDARIAALRFRIMAGVVLSLLLTLIIGQALSRQFLSPIRNLARATLAIGAQNFAHRIPVVDEDEFGHLNQVFNRVIEGLGELEVAKIVQESLFPGNHFTAGRFSIYGRSVVMTTLGGDYYDCLQINKEHWGLVIGDVAGHGVPAGLMMAMAKASVLMAPESEKMDAAVLTGRLHRMFFAIKNDRLKRMMTFQYYVLRPADGHFSFANAGHCFPVVVKPAEKSAELIEHIATPLGIGPRARYKNFEFDIAPGESLLLYTDGIAEAKNSEGEEFGYERLRQLSLDAWDRDPETYYRRIFAAYEQWSARPDDDLTIIVVNHDA